MYSATAQAILKPSNVEVPRPTKHSHARIEAVHDALQDRVLVAHPVRVEVEGRIDGDIVIESDMTPTLGFYRSADNTLIWNQSTSPELKSLLPGDSMRLGFTFSIEDLYNPETQDLVRNPEIFLKLTARGRRVSERNVPEDVVNTVERTVKVNSQVGLSVASTYSTGPFENTGPIPPEIETPTTYTINLSVDNTSNALANGVYEAKLPPYVSWMDTFAPRDESVSYDPVTRVVKWRVGDVPAGAGYSAPSVDLAFQVTLFPSVTQTRDDVDLLSESTFTYYDRFTGQNLIIEHPPVSTKLETDPMYRPGLEVVTDPNAVVR